MYYSGLGREKDEASGCGIALLLMVVWLLPCWPALGCGQIWGISIGKRQIRTEAVQRGKGEWVVSPQGGVTFKWKEEEPTE